MAASFFSGDTWGNSIEGFVIADAHGLNDSANDSPIGLGEAKTGGLGTATAGEHVVGTGVLLVSLRLFHRV